MARRNLVDRIVWVILAAVATAVIVTARVLTPDPVHGSSAQLGLPPCGFQVFTGYKCPGCGLTTCFSYMAHFDLAGAWHANAFGIALFLATLIFVPFAVVSAWRGLGVTETLGRIHAERIVIALALLSLTNFLVRFGFELAAS
jgi:hypothetical protein